MENAGTAYYGTVNDAVIDESKQLYLRCDYDTVGEEDQTDTAVSGFGYLGWNEENIFSVLPLEFGLA